MGWYEPPGLASLEAAGCGCPVVVTPGGSTREYFLDEAGYCAPDDPASILGAIGEASTRPRNLELAGRVARDFTWDIAAEQTIDAYRAALGHRESRGPALSRPRARRRSAPMTAAT